MNCDKSIEWKQKKQWDKELVHFGKKLPDTNSNFLSNKSLETIEDDWLNKVRSKWTEGQKSLYIWLFLVKQFWWTTSRHEFKFFEQYKFGNAWRWLIKTQKKKLPHGISHLLYPRNHLFPRAENDNFEKSACTYVLSACTYFKITYFDFFWKVHALNA